MNQKKPNIIWIVIDSVRNYRSGGDDRDKLDIMNKIATESLEFKHVVTSAPSTIMSISAMMTSLPSYYIARNYVDFKYDNSVLRPLKSILQDEGYRNYAINAYRDGREKLSSIFDFVDESYWPAGLTHMKTLTVQEKVDEGVYKEIHPYVWTNSDVNAVLHNLLAHGVQQPFFIYIHYNCRWDPKTSESIEQGLQEFKDLGLYKDSLVIMCSDHGYPDPSRGYAPRKLKQMGLTHDLLLTDDNILVPLYIRFPGGAKMGTIDTIVSTLDIMPTILDILDQDLPQDVPYTLQGRSLMPLIEGGIDGGWLDRKVRVDSRLLFQDKRITAIRGNSYKYLIYHDTQQERLYDLVNDPLERHNLLEAPLTDETRQVLETFRSAFSESESSAREFQFQYILSRLKEHLLTLTRGNETCQVYNIALLGKCPPAYITMLLQVIKSVFPESDITLLVEESFPETNLQQHKSVEFVNVGSNGFVTRGTLDKYLATGLKEADLWIVALESFDTAEAKQLIARVKKRRRRALLIIDVNGDRYVSKPRKLYLNIAKILRGRLRFYLRNPGLLMKDIAGFVRTRNITSLSK